MDYNITVREKDGGVQVIVSYKDQYGKWRQKSKQGFKGKREAKRYGDKIVENLKEKMKSHISIEHDGITLGEFREMYIKHISLYNEYNTVRNTKFALNKLNKLNDMKMEDITALHIQNCVDDMVKDGLKPSSIKTYAAMIKTFFNTAVEPFQIIKENPITIIRIPEEKEDEEIKALTKQEFEDLIRKLKHPRTRLIALLAGTCGLRLGEIMGLTWNNIDFINGKLTVEKQWKKNFDNKWEFGTVKQTNSYRVIPVPPRTIRELKQYKVNNPTDIRNRLILANDKNSLTRDLKMYYNRAGYDITTHTLRHTYATRLVASGLDFKTVAYLLGHDVEMTMKTYSHVTTDMLDNATDVVNDIF